MVVGLVGVVGDVGVVMLDLRPDLVATMVFLVTGVLVAREEAEVVKKGMMTD